MLIAALTITEFRVPKYFLSIYQLQYARASR